jgi:hypothetical protein
VPFQGEQGRYLPGPRRAINKETGKLEIVEPAPWMPVPWTVYWRQRLVNGLIELQGADSAALVKVEE